ncbi:MAG: transporter substrate-binding domain-containing protein [Candidatus Binatia bacterium]
MDREGRLVKLLADPFPPYQYAHGAEVAGLDYEIVRSAFRSEGFEVDVALRPWTDCMRRVEDGRADGAFQTAKTPERERRFLFSDLLRTATTALYCHADRTIALQSNALGAQLREYATAVVEGYSYGPEFDGLPDLRKVVVGSNGESLLALSAHDADLAILDDGVAVHLIKELRLDGVQRVAGFQIQRALFVAFRRSRADLVASFNSGLTTIRHDGEYDRLLASYDMSPARDWAEPSS